MWSARFQGRTLDEVTTAELEKIRVERLKTPPPPEDETDKPRKAVTNATVNREFAFLKHVFNIAVRDGKTTSNPVAKLKMLREPSGRVRYLSDEEEARLMKALPAERDRERVTVLLQTGFRRGEFLALRVRQPPRDGGRRPTHDQGTWRVEEFGDGPALRTSLSGPPAQCYRAPHEQTCGRRESGVE